MKALLDRLGGRWGPALAESLARSWRLAVEGSAAGQALARGGRPYVLVCWHEVLLPVMWHHRGLGLTAVISQARDGEHLAGFARRLGYGLARGSSSRGGEGALRGAIRALQAGQPVGLTPDGPRGPRRVMKPGAVAAAAITGAPLLPVRVWAEPVWRAGSWDRFLVPKPWAVVRLTYGEPLLVARDDAAREQATRRLTAALADGVETSAWPNGAATPTG
ncbi:MAG: lysophospholipid acyltransferase family protein [Gemmatimonadetes bacterium]|nr:lysophospholipid acyltransferase family protein [Gemmatimonadota bacterium]